MSNRPVVTNHRPLFILYLIYGFRIGGAERHLLDLCKGLDRRKFRPEIIYFHRDEQMLSEYRQAGIPCTIFPVKGGELTLREIWRLSRVIKKLSPDVVHVHLFHASRFGTLAAFLAGSKRIVRTKHNVREPGRKPGKRDRLWRLFLPLILTRIVAVSRAIAKQIRTPYVIYNGIDTDYFDPKFIDPTTHAAYARDFGVDGSPVIGIAARLTRQKGHPVLLKAFSQLVSDWPNAQLLIAGEGEELRTLEVLTHDLNLTEHVQFLGSIRNVREFLAVLDIFVHPSHYEGLGIAVIEAMSMARPIVATNLDGLAELITDGVDGLLVEPNNPAALAAAMNRVLRDPALAEQLGRQARKRVVENFSLETMISKYEELYLELCR